MTTGLKQVLLLKRRESVFGISVLISGLAMTSLCVMPTLLMDTLKEPLLPHADQEDLFFRIFGIICGMWLLCWVSALNNWKIAAKTGQWGGIILLCAEQALMAGIWRYTLPHFSDFIGAWLSPLIVQIYLLGLFFGFFTLPGLTQNGNHRLTGLGTLVLLLPWLFGRDAVIAGAEYLHGLLF